MAEKNGKKTNVTARRAHTHEGKAYNEGDAYDVDDPTVLDSLLAQGLVGRTADFPPAAAVDPNAERAKPAKK